MKNKLFVLSAIAIAIIGFFILKTSTEREKSTQTAAPVVSSAVFVRPHSPTYGNSLGLVTVVEWFDPECESCRMFHPTFEKIVSEYKDRVHFVLRYMPYHGNSMFVASALEEAKELGKFNEALTLLFEKQPEWGDHHAPRPELVVEYLAGIGIPKAKLEKTDLVNKHSEKIRLDEADGKEVGVEGTPTFFVNGKMLPHLGEEPLRDAIERALKN